MIYIKEEFIKRIRHIKKNTSQFKSNSKSFYDAVGYNKAINDILYMIDIEGDIIVKE